VLDHGCGLQSIYGHLREIDARKTTWSERDRRWRSGETGFTGGVHVHFSMQIDGVQVNPREWWDEHWIHDRIMSKL
jgi:murein DD-endopeptidase MepM/ murein hydrolase activator NlpD